MVMQQGVHSVGHETHTKSPSTLSLFLLPIFVRNLFHKAIQKETVFYAIPTQYDFYFLM